MDKFSSWNADAVLARYMVDGDKDYLLDMKKDLETEYQRWERTNRLKNGLYWQGDVQDGMEESISGGRRKKYARPTINSYMYGNAKALSCIGILSGDEGMAMKYGMRADTLKNLVENELWNTRHQFLRRCVRTLPRMCVKQSDIFLGISTCRIPPKSMKLPGKKLWMKKASLLLMD